MKKWVNSFLRKIWMIILAPIFSIPATLGLSNRYRMDFDLFSLNGFFMFILITAIFAVLLYILGSR